MNIQHFIDVLECISLSILGWEEYISLFKFFKKIVQSYSTPREGLCNSFIVLNKTDNPDSLN